MKTISASEIWLVNLDPSLGAEIRKIRPAIVMSSDAVGVLPLRVVVPITAWQPKFAACNWLVKLEPDSQNGLEKTSTADAFQVRSISVQRFVARLGEISGADRERIQDAIKAVFEM